MSRSFVPRTAAAMLLSLLFVTGSASVASAHPDPGGPGGAGQSGDVTSVQNCPLRRIDTQLVRCDNLTGAGVPAPAFILELVPSR